jgi:hypothetical protein
MKKLILALSLLFVSLTQSVNFYPIFDRLGSCADFILSKGKLSTKHEQQFQSVTASLGLKNRDIKARNSGFLLRFLCGYQNALAFQLLL